ncbi:hypothetical protein N0V93_009864 [Gnomoniopsis smithogilvyi]|uniref:Ribosomal RNA-processing protein 1 n=1 Tax=Gnomoniopsis smithogilvyi TaxID=1191159 RepID=A0A9W9CSQ1_9PEZI|nr:hypothetical protein N0V93_009864 [Gnomoniopsis smithogilvyi]
MASQESSMPFIRNMASSDRKTRTAALDSLRTFLSSKAISTNLSTLDTLKLWKGLFYALWMCDRPLPQQQLCTDLSELIWVLPEDAVPRWLRAFWATMAREWTTGIDVLRMEKFLLLVRRMLGASLVWMQVREKQQQQKKNKSSSSSKKRTASGKTKSAAAAAEAEAEIVQFDAKRVEVVLTLLADWPFRPDEESRREEEEDDLMPKTVPVGLKLHALDIWVDEAEKAGLLLEGEGEDEDKKKKKKKEEEENDSLTGREVLQRVNDQVDTLNSQTLSKAVRIRSKESLADDRLPWNEKDEAEKDDGEWGGLDD